MNVRPFAVSELDDGLVVLTEHLPGVRSASMGVWVRAGSVHEPADQLGVSHLLEHMVFKGSKNRTARDFALVLERLGGSLDAYTSREHTGFQARVLDRHVDTGLEVLADLVLNPLLRSSDLEVERQVVLEEIARVDDTPDDLIFDLHASALWGEHPYGQPILGTRRTVSSIAEADLRRVHRRYYRRPNLVIAAAGNVDHELVVNLAEELFAEAGDGARADRVETPAMSEPREERVLRETAQTHVVFGTATFGHADPRRFALGLLSAAFGGGMSSRLFQRVREELGLAYSVYAFQSLYGENGIAGVYAGTGHDRAERAIEVIREEYASVAADGLTPDELQDAKNQLKGNLILALESTSARLHRLAGFALYRESFLTLDELAARIDAVTADDIAEVAAEYYSPERQVVLRLGPGG